MDDLYGDLVKYLAEYLTYSSIARLLRTSKKLRSIFSSYLVFEYDKMMLNPEHNIISEYYFIYNSLRSCEYLDNEIYKKEYGYEFIRNNFHSNILNIKSNTLKILRSSYEKDKFILFQLFTPNIEYIFCYNNVTLLEKMHRLQVIICNKLQFKVNCVYESVKYIDVANVIKLNTLLRSFPNVEKASLTISFKDLIKYDEKSQFNNLTYLQLYFYNLDSGSDIDNHLLNRGLKNIRILCPKLEHLNFWPTVEFTYPRLRNIINEIPPYHNKIRKYFINKGITFSSTRYLNWPTYDPRNN